MKSKTITKFVPILLLGSSLLNTYGHPVVVHEQITSNAVAYAQQYSHGYTNFINSISVPSALLAQSLFPLPYQSQSPTAFNLLLPYYTSQMLDPTLIYLFPETPLGWMVIGSAMEDGKNILYSPIVSQAAAVAGS